jgi:type I restriction enzyme R subunit
LSLDNDTSLGAMIHDPGCRNLLPEAVFQKARIIQQVGNQAVHEQKPVRQLDAMQAVKELHHLCYWLTRTYAPDASREGAAWWDARVPQPVTSAAVVPRKDLEALEKQLEEQAKETLQRQQEKDALDPELQLLRAQLAAAKAAAEKKPDTHDYSETQTRHYPENSRAGTVRRTPQHPCKHVARRSQRHEPGQLHGARPPRACGKIQECGIRGHSLR